MSLVPPTNDAAPDDDGPPIVMPVDVNDADAAPEAVAAVESTEPAPDHNWDALPAQALAVVRGAQTPLTGEQIAAELNAVQGAKHVPLGKLLHVLDKMVGEPDKGLRSMPLGDPPQRTHYLSAKVSPMGVMATARAAVIDLVADLSEPTPDPAKVYGLPLYEIVAKLKATVDSDTTEADVLPVVEALVTAGKLKAVPVKAKHSSTTDTIYVAITVWKDEPGWEDEMVYDVAPGVITAVVQAGALAVATSTLPPQEGTEATAKPTTGEDATTYQRQIAEQLEKERKAHAATTKERDALRSYLHDRGLTGPDIDAICKPAKKEKFGISVQPESKPGQPRVTFLYEKRVPMDDAGRAELFEQYLAEEAKERHAKAGVEVATANLKTVKGDYDKIATETNDRKAEIMSERAGSTRLLRCMAYKEHDWHAREDVIFNAATGEELERKALPKGTQTLIPGTGAEPKAEAAKNETAPKGSKADAKAAALAPTTDPSVTNAPAASAESTGDTKATEPATTPAEPTTAPAPAAAATEGDAEADDAAAEPAAAAEEPPPAIPDGAKDGGAKVSMFVEPLFQMIEARGDCLKSNLENTFADHTKKTVGPSVGMLLKGALVVLLKAKRIVQDNDILRVAPPKKARAAKPKSDGAAAAPSDAE